MGRSIRFEEGYWGKSLYVQGKVPVDFLDFIDDIINVGLKTIMRAEHVNTDSSFDTTPLYLEFTQGGIRDLL